MGFLYLRLLCVACKSSIVSQTKINVHNNTCGNGCDLTAECWLRYGPGESILLFAGSVKMFMMFAPCGDRGCLHNLPCLILLRFRPYFIFNAMKV